MVRLRGLEDALRRLRLRRVAPDLELEAIHSLPDDRPPRMRGVTAAVVVCHAREPPGDANGVERRARRPAALGTQRFSATRSPTPGS